MNVIDEPMVDSAGEDSACDDLFVKFLWTTHIWKSSYETTYISGCYYSLNVPAMTMYETIDKLHR